MREFLLPFRSTAGDLAPGRSFEPSDFGARFCAIDMVRMLKIRRVHVTGSTCAMINEVMKCENTGSQ